MITATPESNRGRSKTHNLYRWEHFLVIVVYMCVFIIPSASLSGQLFNITKPIFMASSILVFAMVFRTVISISDLLIIVLIGLVCVLTRNLRVVSWISTLVLYRLLSLGQADNIREIVMKTKMNEISIGFTVFYSLAYGIPTIEEGHYQLARTAIFEVNESGLALLCLGIIYRKKSIPISNLILCFGTLTLSRNYFLSLIIIVVLNCNGIKNILYKLYRYGVLKFSTIIMVSTLVLLGVGMLYLKWWDAGEITYIAGASRLFNFKDYSNFYRFSTNIMFFKILKNDISLLFTGIPNIVQYKDMVARMSSSLGVITMQNTPHNFMFAYIRLYGIFSIFLLFYINKIVNSIINRHNLNIFLSMCLYPIFLSVGFNSYWLYLTVFAVLSYTSDEARLFRIKFRLRRC